MDPAAPETPAPETPDPGVPTEFDLLAEAAAAAFAVRHQRILDEVRAEHEAELEQDRLHEAYTSIRATARAETERELEADFAAGRHPAWARARIRHGR